jgi:hypothetical protein
MAIPQDIALKNQEFGHNVKNDLINNMIKSQKTGGN